MEWPIPLPPAKRACRLSNRLSPADNILPLISPSDTTASSLPHLMEPSTIASSPSVSQSARFGYRQSREQKQNNFTMSSPVKFDIPASARSFTCFSRLPPEIREQIWEDAIFEPGMHFLRLRTAARITHYPSPMPPGSLGDQDTKDEDDVLLDFAQESVPTRVWPAILEPRYPTPQANISNYVSTNQVLKKLSATCFESAKVVRRLTSAPGGLKLKGDRVVSLGGSFDIVCLEYLSADDFRSWCRISQSIKCNELANIRHVAIPYCHAWETSVGGFRCGHCGTRSSGLATKVYPVHLYEFLAQYLPNLETFYFIDYLIVQKDKSIDSLEVIPAQITTSNQAAAPSFDIRPQNSILEPSKKRTKEDTDDVRLSPNRVTEMIKTLKVTNSTKREIEPRSANPSAKAVTHGFKCQGRVFHEPDEDHWDVKSRVVDTISWLQKRFILYATQSKNSRHAHPEKVQFKVLACKWNEREPDTQPRLKRAAPVVQKISTKKPQAQCYKQDVPPAQEQKAPLASPSSPPLLVSTKGFNYVFGREDGCNFSFSQASGL
ncbi:uncharacterized protein CCOS01_03938 [Colletotrichum costaricense]|uniref:2EXR domain-containing protein n=1 Tax=Colletotrichum costaricense TaxID=1209916 RepID=A0AAI9Z7K0_9PEZI|nr:uncharacterized protein CCOS01_03938 [Colletotrichum costaricense]KAI3540159.1 hypothetical protein CSPX01_08348 [Colletotrichum filicis]KAK1535186.1 hypothetical protein CCOS01_03938 [Colletotrichum costaricense]